jgi:hypothetical protein
VEPRSFLANGALGLELAHRTVERRWVYAHCAAHLANRDAGLGGHALEHLLASLTGLCQYTARRVIANVDAESLGKLAQLAVLLDQRLELPDPDREVPLEPAKIAQDRRRALPGFSVRSDKR